MICGGKLIGNGGPTLSVSIRIFVPRTLMIGLVDICHILVFFELCNRSVVAVRKSAILIPALCCRKSER